MFSYLFIEQIFDAHYGLFPNLGHMKTVVYKT